MSLLTVLLALIVVGVVLYVVNRFIPMEQRIKSILNFVVIAAVIFWLFRVSGAWGYLSKIRL